MADVILFHLAKIYDGITPHNLSTSPCYKVHLFDTTSYFATTAHVNVHALFDAYTKVPPSTPDVMYTAYTCMYVCSKSRPNKAIYAQKKTTRIQKKYNTLVMWKFLYKAHVLHTTCGPTCNCIGNACLAGVTTMLVQLWSTA